MSAHMTRQVTSLCKRHGAAGDLTRERFLVRVSRANMNGHRAGRLEALLAVSALVRQLARV